MEKVKVQYQGKAEVLLNALLDGAGEDLKLSNARMVKLRESGDLVALRMEREMNDIYKKKKSKLESLVKMEKNVSCSVPYVVTVGWQDEDGGIFGKESYVSKCKRVG